MQKLVPLIDPFEVEPEDEPFSLRAIQSTIKKIRFKLRKKEKEEGKDDVYEASRRVKELDEALTNRAQETAATRLKQFSRTLFVDYRNKIADLNRSVHPTPVQLEELPQDLVLMGLAVEDRKPTAVAQWKTGQKVVARIVPCAIPSRS